MLQHQEFGKYEASGAYHWRATYPQEWRRSSPILHARYDAALRKLCELLPVKSSRGLDLGCGDGVLLFKIAQRGGRAIGLDGMFQALCIARHETRARAVLDCPLVSGSATAIPLLDDSVDYVMSLEVVEHVEDSVQYFTEIRRVLRLGGVLIVTTPSRTADGVLHDPYHSREYRAPELIELARPLFADVAVFGMYPRLLSRLYERGAGLSALDKVIRFAFKVSLLLGWNAFDRWLTHEPDERWNGLLLVCRK